MKNKKLWIGITFLGLTLIVASAAILFRKPLEAHAVRPIFHGETTTYRYSGEVLDTGDVLVNVYYLRGGDKAIHAYREANIERSRSLLAQGIPKLIYVHVIFARPVPVAEVRSLVEKTGFQVKDFLMVSRPKERRSWCIEATGDLDKPFCANEGFEGIMVLKGWVETTQQGLGQWLADDRVYMVDTTAVEVRELVAQRHADIVAGKEIIVDMELPIWEMDW